MHVRANGAAGVLALIRSSYSATLAYDSQVEESRARYTVELAEAAGDLETLRSAVFRELFTVEVEHEAWYLADLTAVLAQRGDSAARRILREAFEHHLGAGRAVGTYDIVDLDRTEGLMWVAERMGRNLGKIAEHRPRALMNHVEYCPSKYAPAIEILTTTAGRNADIQRFLDAARAPSESEYAARIAQMTSPQTWLAARSAIEAEIAKGDRSAAISVVRRWARQADDKELVLCARSLLAESDP
ncbi:MAG TPA: hypothetical protein VG797_08285, partial [Phycisphaerales bacterium]|nr:hypothetical protein [Phycisphaerales bacterium]